MNSIRGTVANAVSRKRMPAHQAGSTRDLAFRLRMTAPISVAALIEAVNGLPAAAIVFNSGDLGPSTVTGSVQVGLQSDGTASISSHVRESGAIGHNYVIATALLDVVDSNGNALVFVHEGTVHGTFAIGKRDDDKQTDGSNPLIASQWETVKTSRVQHRLHVSTDPIDAVESVVPALFAAAVAVGVVLFAADPKTRCDWQRADDGQGIDFVCVRPID
ncbi:MAG: hypothetical protein QOJ39_1246 [Candidatus Eremiobacteraeota bacterium]|jgi:hypothetical protein|nr:hypothetical protein [Candidatus Eremiobacteraeota bacterium]